MGSSKRYAEQIDARMSERADQTVMRDGTPDSLTASELELKTEPLTRTPQPLPVLAWVRYGGIGLKVKARAVAWTPKAVAVEWDTPNGPHRAWVWASAVDKRQE